MNNTDKLIQALKDFYQEFQIYIFIGLGILILLIIILQTIKKSKRKALQHSEIDIKQKRKNKLWFTLFPNTKNKTLDIFIFGHSASGKSTLIQNQFTVGNGALKSTEDLDYYEFKKDLNLSGDDTVTIRIADYKGQEPVQILDEIRQKPTINSLLFIVDLVPAYSDLGTKYSDEEITGLLSENLEETLQKRVRQHEDIMSPFMLQIIFQYAMNPKLKSVYLLINKIDVINTLKEYKLIDSDINVEKYARSFFFKIEESINKLCATNHIHDFKVYCISAREFINSQKMFNELISKNY